MTIHVSNMKELNKALQPVLKGMVGEMADRGWLQLPLSGILYWSGLDSDLCQHLTKQTKIFFI